MSGSTPSQTVGPYLHIGLEWEDGAYAAEPETPGAFWLHGRLFDAAAEPVPDGMIETWQADPVGRFDHPDDPRGMRETPGFRGFGRCSTDTKGEWAIHTLKPGSLPAGDTETEAPHLDVSVFARGLLNRLVTRIYFADEEAANAADPVLKSVDADRRHTLIAKASERGFVFDIHLQGEDETVFFDV
ncbi:MAG: protocatechuate 3,4-dioxygenase subunit alpha [Propionibacteriales bacterium]|nr:protocatechuate 3,4-dioxygenase subunit alpha [Propionibacteriales bacterium]